MLTVPVVVVMGRNFHMSADAFLGRPGVRASHPTVDLRPRALAHTRRRRRQYYSPGDRWHKRSHIRISHHHHHIVVAISVIAHMLVFLFGAKVILWHTTGGNMNHSRSSAHTNTHTYRVNIYGIAYSDVVVFVVFVVVVSPAPPHAVALYHLCSRQQQSTHTALAYVSQIAHGMGGGSTHTHIQTPNINVRFHVSQRYHNNRVIRIRAHAYAARHASGRRPTRIYQSGA